MNMIMKQMILNSSECVVFICCQIISMFTINLVYLLSGHFSIILKIVEQYEVNSFLHLVCYLARKICNKLNVILPMKLYIIRAQTND